MRCELQGSLASYVLPGCWNGGSCVHLKVHGSHVAYNCAWPRHVMHHVSRVLARAGSPGLSQAMCICFKGATKTKFAEQKGVHHEYQTVSFTTTLRVMISVADWPDPCMLELRSHHGLVSDATCCVCCDVLCSSLCYSCSVCRIKAKLVWVLSFVLAPYAHILSQATHKTDAHRFVASVMPRLLEQSRAHQPAALQDTSGIHLALLVCSRLWPSPELYLHNGLL